MSKGSTSKALKDANRPKLWTTIAANVAVLYAFSQYHAVSTAGLKGVVAGATSLVPLSLALILTTVANGLLSDPTKTRLVFLRWKHALPGHRAFSVFAASDPRIDLDGLRKLLGKDWPTDPVAENRMWYRLFKDSENDPAVLYSHGEYLFTRDYTGFAAMCLIGLGAAAAFMIEPATTLMVYLGCLLLQFLLVRHTAATYGERFVCTVLARKAARPLKQPTSTTRRDPKPGKAI
ncbi:hypothetical protein [Methylobacterium goesingense]|uniref:Glycosyl-4,4'-diaponeurosporenoate acyltransferase n=1 Tax=Methylobacterium goesingense TaxID=243690 RepID=A0ABV2LD77_9HYPH|nr:hypothetical protein [Methylobacterium goesingense]GJD75396.1 hypothetical protein CFIICLFH_3637 [Methylobacterium goesingense]